MNNQGNVKPREKMGEEKFKAWYLPVINKKFKLPDGKVDTFTCVAKKDVVTVFMLTDARDVVLAKQFRPWPERIMYDPPGGSVEPGQTPDEAAIAELTSETGYSFKTLEYVWSTFQDAYETRKRLIYVALGCYPNPNEGQKLDANEFIEVIEMALKDYLEMVKQGEEVTDTLVVLRALMHLWYLKENLP